MSRVWIAVPAGLLGFFVYIAGVMILADRVAPFGGLAQAVFFVLAGVLWVPAAHLLILWAARK